MFKLTKFTGDEFYINPDHIKYIVDGGDTVVHLITGERLLVKDSVEEIQAKFEAYKRHAAPGTFMINELEETNTV